MKQWDSGDFSRHVSVLNYPNSLATYVQKSYIELKAQQAALTRAGA
jgi:hypothetical protein